MDKKGSFMSAFEAFVTQKEQEIPDPVESTGKHMLLHSTIFQPRVNKFK